MEGPSSQVPQRQNLLRRFGAAFIRWVDEEADSSRPRTRSVVRLVIRTFTDPVLWIVIFGPAIIQFTLAVVVKSAPGLSADVASMVSNSTFCGLLSYSTTLFVAFISWLVQLFQSASAAIAVYVYSRKEETESSSGRSVRGAICIIALVVFVFYGVSLFALGRAGAEVMLYQGGRCFELGGGFEFPPLDSLITWLRFSLVGYALLDATLALSPRYWKPTA